MIIPIAVAKVALTPIDLMRPQRPAIVVLKPTHLVPGAPLQKDNDIDRR